MRWLLGVFTLWTASSATRPAYAEAPRAERARELYVEGKAEYAQGRYLTAIERFERAYQLSEAPALLFNMAQAHRLAGPGHCSKAVTLYRSYLEALPSAENLREVEERIAELGECPNDSVASLPPPVVSESEPRDPSPSTSWIIRPSGVAAPAPSGSPTAPILLTGVGSALLVAGGVLFARAWDKHREAEKLCPCYPGSYSEWEVLTNVSYAVLAVGGVTVASGVSWWMLAAPSSGASPREAWVGVRGQF